MRRTASLGELLSTSERPAKPQLLFIVKALLRHVSQGHSSRGNDLEPPQLQCGRRDVAPRDLLWRGVAAALLHSLAAVVPRDQARV